MFFLRKPPEYNLIKAREKIEEICHKNLSREVMDYACLLNNIVFYISAYIKCNPKKKLKRIVNIALKSLVKNNILMWPAKINDKIRIYTIPFLDITLNIQFEEIFLIIDRKYILLSIDSNGLVSYHRLIEFLTKNIKKYEN